MTTEEEIEKADEESKSHASGCRCMFCFSRNWPLKNPGKCYVCGGVRGHDRHDPPYDGVLVRRDA
jgi:hypothetical protein